MRDRIETPPPESFLLSASVSDTFVSHKMSCNTEPKKKKKKYWFVCTAVFLQFNHQHFHMTIFILCSRSRYSEEFRSYLFTAEVLVMVAQREPSSVPHTMQGLQPLTLSRKRLLKHRALPLSTQFIILKPHFLKQDTEQMLVYYRSLVGGCINGLCSLQTIHLRWEIK